MSSTELIEGIKIIKGKFAGEFGFISSYLIFDEDEVLIIDPGTAGHPGEMIVDAIKNHGLKPKSDTVGIICTHGHPDHIGGVKRIQKETNAPVMIHSNDAELLQNPQTFINNRLRIDFAGRMQMKLEKGPMRVNYRKHEPDSTFEDGEIIEVGNTGLEVIHTGGHSAGHCVFYDRARKALFSGDEINCFPNDPHKFYVDLSGSFTAKLNAIERLKSLNIEYLLPAHDVSHIMNDAPQQLIEVRNAVIQFQDTVLEHLKNRQEADIDQLVFDIKQARSIPVPQSLPYLLPTTIQVCLEGLSKAGLVVCKENELWSLI
jgi:glyoxylase-like metal-dependent hydrolase (beta-lactamase superfamily II)